MPKLAGVNNAFIIVWNEHPFGDPHFWTNLTIDSKRRYAIHEQLQSWLRMWYHYSAMSNFIVGIAKVEGHECLLTACSSWRYDYFSTPYCRYVFNQCFVVCFIFLIQKWSFSAVLPVHAMNAMKRRVVYSQVWTSTRPSDVGLFKWSRSESCLIYSS